MEQNFFKEILKEERERKNQYWIHFIGITAICISITAQYLFPYWRMTFLQKHIGINLNSTLYSDGIDQQYKESLTANQQLKKQLTVMNHIHQLQQKSSIEFWNYIKEYPITIKVNGIQYKNDGTLNYYIETKEIQDAALWIETLNTSHELKVLRCNELKYINDQYQLHIQCQYKIRGDRKDGKKADKLAFKQ